MIFTEQVAFVGYVAQVPLIFTMAKEKKKRFNCVLQNIYSIKLFTRLSIYR